jgi:predicted transcriptional regulator of viral defense system
MAYRNAQTAYRALVAAARLQGGYVTASQAAEAGFGYSHLTYHVQAGNLERVARGLYRLAEVAPSEHDQLIRLTLLTRGQGDRLQATVSHASALALHELSDVLPRKVHLTVPPGFRQRPPDGCVLHKADLADDEQEEWEGFSVTTPLRTLLDVAAEGRFPREQFDRAVGDALRAGLVTRSGLRRALGQVATVAARERLDAALTSAKA